MAAGLWADAFVNLWRATARCKAQSKLTLPQTRQPAKRLPLAAIPFINKEMTEYVGFTRLHGHLSRESEIALPATMPLLLCGLRPTMLRSRQDLARDPSPFESLAVARDRAHRSRQRSSARAKAFARRDHAAPRRSFDPARHARLSPSQVDAIVAYDDASTDETVEILRKHPSVAFVIANGAGSRMSRRASLPRVVIAACCSRARARRCSSTGRSASIPTNG